MTDYNMLKKPGRKKLLLFFGLVFFACAAFFFINSAKMDDFTSLITDASIQYQDQGMMKDYTSDISLEDQTPLSLTIKATLPQGTLSSLEDVDKDGETTQETVVKNQSLTFQLPEQLQIEDKESHQIYREEDLIHSVGMYQIKNHLLTMYFNDDFVKENAQSELKLDLILETDSSHIQYDESGVSHILFNQKELEIHKYQEESPQSTVVHQVNQQVLNDTEIKNQSTEPEDTNNDEEVAAQDVEVQSDTDQSVDFGQYITSSTVQKLVGNQWTTSDTFEDGDQVKVRLNYTLPSNIVTSDNKTISYQLPNGLKPLKEESGIVYASNGKAVGTYVIGTDGKITITYNDEFATGEPFTGYIEFQGTVSASDAGDGGKIKFGDSGGTITVKPSQSKYDLNVAKKGTLESDGKVHYTITASSNNGTESTVSIKDKFVDWDTATASYDKDSFKIVKVDKDGNKTDITGYDPQINGESFTIDNLPQLKAGEKYEITYSTDAKAGGKDGSGSLTNSVQATSGNTSRSGMTTVSISHSMISKHGGYDQKTGKMNWTITLNSDKKDISGYVLNDTIQEGLKLPEKVTLKKSDGTSEKVTLPYTFPDGSQDTYTIEYQTDAPSENGNVKNTATIGKDGTSYESDSDVHVTHREWNVRKTAKNKTVSSDGKSMENHWQAYIDLPDEEISSITYSDVIKNGTSKDDSDFNGEHYAILSELRNEILNNAQLTLSDGTVLTQNDLDIEIKFYSDEEKTKEVTADDAHVKAFEVRIQKKDKSSFKGLSFNISDYHTIADLSDIKEGIDYSFGNTGTVGDKTSSSSVTYNKPKKFVKQAYGVPQGGSYEKYTSGKVNADYTSHNGKLYYRIIFQPDSNEDVSFTDTLPSGTKLAKIGERSDYTTQGTTTPEKRGSPEVLYYFNDNTEYYVDGNDLTDIRKYFNYQYDENSNKVTFNFQSGYNKTDGDYGTGKRTHPNGSIVIYYAVDITSDDFWKDLNNSSKEYTNILEYDGHKQEQHTEVERDIPNLIKTAKQIDNSTQVEYSVTINPAAKNLNPDSDKITLKDQLDLYYAYSAYLNLSQTKLYEYDATKEDGRGTEIDASRYQIQYNETDHTLTVTLPDELACVLVYRYDFNFGNANNPTITNKASLEGEYDSSINTKIDTSQSSAGVTRGKLTIYKVDEENYSKMLPGATFKLSQFNPTNNTWDEVTFDGQKTFKTNDKGEIVFSGSSEDKKLQANILYRLEETEAPTGYDKDDNPHYFVIYQADQDKTKQDAIDVLNNQNVSTLTGLNFNTGVSFVPNNKEATLYVPNQSNSLSVKKVWVDQDNKTLTNHPDSIKVKLMKNIKRETGQKVTIHFYKFNGSIDQSNETETKTLYVKNGGHLKVTLKAEGNPQDAQNNVIVKSLSEIQYTFSNKQNWWSQYIVNINNITSDLDLSIYSGGDGAEDYEYDKDYAVHKQQVDEATLDSSNNWSHTWNNLLSKDGNDDCYYTIEEEVPSGYQVSYTNNEGIQKGDIIVTNKKLDNNYDLPDSGGFGTTGYYAIGALLITATLFAYIANKRKKGVQ